MQTGTANPLSVAASSCSFGHAIPQACIIAGFPAESIDTPLPTPWAPKAGVSFLSVGRWNRGSTNLSAGGQLLPSTSLPVTPGGLPEQSPRRTLRWTELCEREGDPLRRLEWVRAKELFYRFVMRDQSVQIELDRVVFLDNPILEVLSPHSFIDFSHNHIAFAGSVLHVMAQHGTPTRSVGSDFVTRVCVQVA